MIITCKVCGHRGAAMTKEALDMFLLEIRMSDDKISRSQGEHMENGGFSRSGTELELCENCDPDSWRNLDQNTKDKIERVLNKIIEG